MSHKHFSILALRTCSLSLSFLELFSLTGVPQAQIGHRRDRSWICSSSSDH